MCCLFVAPSHLMCTISHRPCNVQHSARCLFRVAVPARLAMEPWHAEYQRQPHQIAQVARLEQERTKASEERAAWCHQEAENEKKKEEERWEHQGWWSGWDHREWRSRHGAWWTGAGQHWDRPSDTGATSSEPTTTEAAASSSQDGCMQDEHLTQEGVKADLKTYRSILMSPASFQPQRHVTMLLGRPVVVILG